MSTRSSVFGLFVAVSLSLVGCSSTLQDGRFSCAIDTDCPAGFACRASDMRCYRGVGSDAAVDGGGSVDGSSTSDGALDGGRDANIDAAVGCGPSCIQLMVLNANPDPSSSGTIEFTDTTSAIQHIPIPPYGTTSAVTDVHNVPIGGMLTLNVPPTATIFHMVSIPSEGRYLLVLGPAALGASVQLLASPPTPLHTNNYVYVQVIDQTVDETDGLIARGAGRTAMAMAMPNPFDHMTISPPLPFLPAGGGALRIELAGSSTQLVAALLDDQIPGTEGTYYLVVAGNVSAHLDTPEGLRFIPGLPSMTALRSSCLARFANTLDTNVTVCDGTTPVAMLSPGALSTPRIPPRSGTPWPLTVHVGSDCVTGATHDVSVGAAVGRPLVSIIGDSAATWAAVSVSEPMPIAGNSTIIIYNGLDASTQFDTTTTVPSLSTGSVTLASMPSTVTASTGGGTKTFTWSPTARQSWVVITSPGGGVFEMYEMDAPYSTPWTINAVTGT